MWKLWREHNGYIQGELLSKHASDKAALKKAKTVIEYEYTVRDEDEDGDIIWLENENKMPIGIITHKKGAKRIRQGKKKK